MRKQPGLPPKDINPKQNDKVITQVREYELITPLFGGGVTPAEADPVTIVRATEIRGNLRFWWRACRGGKSEFKGDPAEMKKAEDKIWGKAYEKEDTPPAQDETVQIRVEINHSDTPKTISPFVVVEKEGRKQVRPNSEPETPPAYAAFPLQPTDEDIQAGIEPKTVLVKVSFKLIISFPKEKQKEVEAALWAWETFGGIGARTRRGFGALRCVSIQVNERSVPVNLPQVNQEQVIQWMQTNWKEYTVAGSWSQNVPHLPQYLTQNVNFKLISWDSGSKVSAIWSDLIDCLKNFRQMRRTSTLKNAKHPGRSMWPEPSAIRDLTKQSHPRHVIPIPNPLIKKFPRAVFGLPIIFQFKDRNKYNPNDQNSDPRKTVLQLEAYERLASSLILKPLACQAGEHIGLALILEGIKLDEEALILETQEGRKQQWNNLEASFDQGEALTLTYRTYQAQINSQTDVLQEFLKFL